MNSILRNFESHMSYEDFRTIHKGAAAPKWASIKKISIEYRMNGGELGSTDYSQKSLWLHSKGESKRRNGMETKIDEWKSNKLKRSKSIFSHCASVHDPNVFCICKDSSVRLKPIVDWLKGPSLAMLFIHIFKRLLSLSFFVWVAERLQLSFQFKSACIQRWESWLCFTK